MKSGTRRSNGRWARSQIGPWCRCSGSESAPSGRGSADEGFTLVEAMLSMLIMSVVLALFVPTLLVLTHGQAAVGALADANTEVQPALQQLQNQVNSASVLYDPTNNPSSYYNATVTREGVGGEGFALLLYTASSTTSLECSQWRVYSSSLQVREWNPTHAPATLPFKNVAHGVLVVNSTASHSPQPPFQLEGTSAPQDEALVVTLRLSPSKKGAQLQYKTADTVEGVPTTNTEACAVPPASPKPAPTITSFRPVSGPTSGGTTVTITGTHLTGASVKFGTTSAATVHVTSSTTITARTRAHAAGGVTITVTTTGGTVTSSSLSPSQYTFVAGH